MRFGRQAKLNHRDAGFTMAELVVAMVIIAGVLLLLMVVQVSAMRTISDANRKQQASAFANESMEELRSLPWNVLRQGLANNFVSAAGGDPYVTGSTVTIPGDTLDLVVAPAAGTAGAQDTSDPWTPLFDSSGSNKVIRDDPATPGIQFAVRSYVTEAIGGSDAAAGLLVIASWTDSHGDTKTYAIRSTAFAPSGGCGDLSTQPFKAPCQAILESHASSGHISSNVVATTVPPDNAQTTLLPTISSLSMGADTGNAEASMSSIQTTRVEATVHQGGSQSRTGSNSFVDEGYTTSTAVASNDTVSSNAPPADSKTTGYTPADGPFITAGSYHGISMHVKPDYRRVGYFHASTNTSCAAGVTPGMPCAFAQLDAFSGAGGEILSDVDYDTGGPTEELNFTYRDWGGDTNSDALAVRFGDSVVGTAATGCTTATAVGCAAGVAHEEFDGLLAGQLNGAGLAWDTGHTSLVVIDGYSDEIKVERGAAATQKSKNSVATRSGTYSYFNGSSWTTKSFSATTNTTVSVPQATWHSADGQWHVVAKPEISVTAASQTEYEPDTNCVDDVCAIDANTGNITVNVVYTVTYSGTGKSWQFQATTTVYGSSAKAVFREAPVA